MSYQELRRIRYCGFREVMNPKLIGFLGFEGVAASELTRAADLLAAATLDGGYGNRISCYHVCTIGVTSERFRAESGVAFLRSAAGFMVWRQLRYSMAAKSPLTGVTRTK